MSKEIIRMNTTALAYLGDAVYEVEIRKRMLLKRPDHVDQLHRQSVGYVRAEAQAAAIRTLMEELTQEEADLVRRARNRKILSKPKNLDPITLSWPRRLRLSSAISTFQSKGTGWMKFS